jgi:hypothetical protein
LFTIFTPHSSHCQNDQPAKTINQCSPPIYCSVSPSVVNITKHCFLHSHEGDDLIDYCSRQPHHIEWELVTPESDFYLVSFTVWALSRQMTLLSSILHVYQATQILSWICTQLSRTDFHISSINHIDWFIDPWINQYDSYDGIEPIGRFGDILWDEISQKRGDMWNTIGASTGWSFWLVDRFGSDLQK